MDTNNAETRIVLVLLNKIWQKDRRTGGEKSKENQAHTYTNKDPELLPKL